MKFSTLLRHLREGFKNIIRNGWMSFASFSSIGISLFILGVFLLLALNVNSIADQIESRVQIKVFLELNVEDGKVNELRNQIGSMPEVRAITFISKDQGLEELRESLGDLLEGYDSTNNPLPHAFTVEVITPETIGFVARKIEAINDTDNTAPINDVTYSQGAVEQLFRVTDAIRNVGLVLVAGLALTSMFLISNTIKITILARRREIGIMKLVGATNHFIRWPFFVEGAVIGLLGSAITVVFLLIGYEQLVVSTQMQLALVDVRLIEMEQLVVPVGGLLLAIGTLIGIWGSTISVRKYLKV